MRAPASASANLRAVPSLVELTERFSRKKLVVVGDLVADHYLYGQTDRVSREAPVLIVRYEQSEVKLGGAANAAANARALGGQVTAVGALGADEMGGLLRRQLRAAGIRAAVATSKQIQTETKMRILAGGVNTTRQQMLRVDRGGVGPLPSKVTMELVRLVAEAAASADAVVVSDYGGGVVADRVRARLKRLAADGLPVIADSRYQLGSFEGFTVCKPNEPELEQLTGRRVRTDDEVIEAGREAVRRLGCQHLVVTRGHLGMAVFDARGSAELIARHGGEEAVDVTGAGDTVLAAFSLALAAGGTALEAARVANVAGALVVMKPGTATVSRDELVRELRAAR